MKITRPSKGAFRMRSEMRGGCGARVRSRKPLPGGFGHHVRRYYGRCAGCCRWTGTGARRVTPPRAASQETWPEAEKPRPRNLGQSRGGAPEGERADRKVRAASERCGSSAAPFGAPPPFAFIWRQTSWTGLAKLGCGCVARTRSLSLAPCGRGQIAQSAIRRGPGNPSGARPSPGVLRTPPSPARGEGKTRAPPG
jgi:hypothetical protein